MKTLGALVLLALAFLGPAAVGAGELMALPPAAFNKQTGLHRLLTTDSMDHALLAAAIFHETNKVRQQMGLQALQWLEKLNAAAELQSHVGAVYQPPSHTNPFTGIGTPLERVKYSGLSPQKVTENIALIPIYNTGLDSSFGMTRSEDKTTYVDLATGKELKVHTYASYAALVVQAWMNSPGHRENLLDPSVKNLGCSVFPKRGGYGEEMIFSVQVFYTPDKKRPPAVLEPRQASNDTWVIHKHGR